MAFSATRLLPKLRKPQLRRQRSTCSPSPRLFLVRLEAGDIAAAGALLQQRDEVGHQGQFLLRAGPPAQFQRGEQFGELFAVEDHAAEDGVDEGLERLGAAGRASGGESASSRGVLLVLELLVAGADGGLVEAFAGLEAPDVFGDRRPARR